MTIDVNTTQRRIVLEIATALIVKHAPWAVDHTIGRIVHRESGAVVEAEDVRDLLMAHATWMRGKHESRPPEIVTRGLLRDLNLHNRLPRMAVKEGEL